MKFRMKPAAMLIPFTFEGDCEVVELTPVPTSRYVVNVEVGDSSTTQAMQIVQQTKKTMDTFFPKGTVLYVPSRNGVPTLQIFELEEVDEVLKETSPAEEIHKAPGSIKHTTPW